MKVFISCTPYCNYYFCAMRFSLKHMKIPKLPKIVLLLFLTSVSFSCDSLFREPVDGEPLARVGDTYLYKKDVTQLGGKGMSKEDSISLVTSYINNWATKQLLLSKSKINLPEEKLAEFNALVADYRTDLYTRAYKDALVQQGSDTLITEAQLNSFYEQQKENFKLKEKLVKLRFVELPQQFLDKDMVFDRMKRFEEDDVAYLDSIAVQFNKLNLNDSIWVSASRVIDEIDLLTLENEEGYLKKSQFFELEDSLKVYLVKIMDVREVNDIAPLTFIEPTIEQVLLSRRKLDYMRRLETEIIDEAIKKNEFEVYVQEDED